MRGKEGLRRLGGAIKVKHSSTRIVAVSNRLPISLKRKGNQWHIQPGAGGLVTALAPVLSHRGGLWIGWFGTTEEVDLDRVMGVASKEAGYTLHPVFLDPDELHGYYYGFANEIIWPLFHDLHTRCNFRPQYWYTYQEVNRKFAVAVARHSDKVDYVWVHDYHLMNVAQELRNLEEFRRTGFFLHIPFPPADMFLKLPWRSQILRALLDYDFIGFQTMHYRRNFIHCLQLLHSDVSVKGRGPIVTLTIEDRQVRVGALPISMDFKAFAQQAASKEVADLAWTLHENLPDRQILLGVDRLDYTKGIPERLEAFRNALLRFPQLRGKVTLVQIVVPSRVDIPEYQLLKAQIDRLVGEINGQFTRSGWTPIHYLYRSLNREELISYYRTSEIALITPLKDGMNLIAKEYCACKVEENGVLILSEFAGAASQLHKWALLVNPYDIEGMADSIYQAFHMSIVDRGSRMRRLRETIKKADIYWWVDMFLQAALAKRLQDFPPLDDYVPSIRFD
jgi:alpha,alpha-trehalose-phosphate synthase [UDP-forming]